ncbi:hypothetical protein [Photobacterium sp. GJ3]|uniref:hypothetical protein n=1 Tax=Photobacterium sp. GJ3 TaxID=2829502 RepID=UPI00201111BF|nr:hypothetical protein [Photobacterium sp. GJ3]
MKNHRDITEQLDLFQSEPPWSRDDLLASEWLAVISEYSGTHPPTLSVAWASGGSYTAVSEKRSLVNIWPFINVQ